MMALSVLLLAGQAAAAFNISNTLGDGMVLLLSLRRDAGVNGRGSRTSPQRAD